MSTRLARLYRNNILGWYIQKTEPEKVTISVDKFNNSAVHGVVLTGDTSSLDLPLTAELITHANTELDYVSIVAHHPDHPLLTQDVEFIDIDDEDFITLLGDGVITSAE